MKYSEQQQAVINEPGNMVVNAIAGSGKTTTLAGYAKARNAKPILYLAFNNSVKQEALQKFQSLDIKNVRVETAHSLALGHFRNRNFKIYKGSYQPYDIKQILGYQLKDAIADMKFGRHVLQMTAAFCNSVEARVSQLAYPDLIKDVEEKAFVNSAYDLLEKETRRFLGMMKSGEIEMMHDFYLKLYQLSTPDLSFYEHILFDEGQDASQVMLDVFLNQPGQKVIVGDEHQQIYSWRYATNALKLSDFPRKYLDTSYRFGQDIGDLAKAILNTKSHLEEIRVPDIKGKGSSENSKVAATLGRTNGAILVDVIEQLVEKENIKSVYFEGHFNSYTYADEGGSVYDVLNLYLDKHKLIRNPMVKQFKDFSELEIYTEQSGDAPMKGIMEIVKTYGKELPRMINCIKDNHVEHTEKQEVDMIYSTVHKAKGMEYDQVHLLEDFLGEEKLLDLLNRSDIHADPDRLLEDINILYVALTRAKSKVVLPQSLIPEDYEPEGKEALEVLMPKLETISGEGFEDFRNAVSKVSSEVKKAVGKAFSHEEVRKTKPSAYKPWTSEEDDELELLFVNQASVKEMADHFGRSRGAIHSRIKKLELRDKYFDVG
ncbi:MAG: 3'-5' exonuclease [Marinoscillum sp.]